MPAVSERQRRATEVEKAYLAGIVDGEGCIGAARYLRLKDGLHNKRGRYAMFTVFVSMTDREAVDLICEIYGGHIRTQIDRRGNGNRRPIHTWQGYSKIGARFLADILPYLRVKARQARLYIEAMDTFTGGPRKGHQGSVSPSADDLARRYAYIDQIQALNQRKVPA